MEPQLPQTEKERKQREYWEKAKEQGPVVYIARNILILLAIDVLFRLAQRGGHLPHWMGSQGSISILEIVADIVTGLVLGAWEWSDLERKFAPRDPTKDRTMI